jgi:hypothetical protein
MPTIHCPFLIRTSHGRNAEGFGADRIDKLGIDCSAVAVECLGVPLDRFALIALPDNRSRLEIASRALETFEARTEFLNHLEVALTAYFGTRSINAYYGTPFVELDRFNLEIFEDRPTEQEAQSTVRLSSKMFMQTTEHHVLPPAAIPTLRFDPLVQLFADGLRASSAESKFFYWFIILEEFLEKNEALNASFRPLFEPKDETALRDFAGKLDGRKKAGMLGCLRLTTEARSEKLMAILHRLGICSVHPVGTTLPITKEVCDNLIKQRNSLFHRGAHINEGPLYNILFPISSILASRSEEIIRLREGNDPLDERD